MALWTSLNWRIARKEEIPHLYEKTISRSGFTAERPLDAYIQRLLMRGLLVCGTGETDYDALYDLLAALYVIPAAAGLRLPEIHPAPSCTFFRCRKALPERPAHGK